MIIKILEMNSKISAIVILPFFFFVSVTELFLDPSRVQLDAIPHIGYEVSILQVRL